MQFFYCLVLLFFAFFPALAHIGGKKPPISSSLRSARCVLHIDGEAFVDNTEYFNKIIEGETLFGFYFLPHLALTIAQDFALDLGLIWEKYFGHIQPWHGIRPALSIYYKKQPTIFVVGIYSLQDHPVTLLEPLYLRRKPFIEGLHFKLGKGKSYLSVWLNWITLLSKTDQTPETFTLHVDGKYCLNNTLAYTIPFQLSMYHLGGQGIPVKDYSLWCGTAGLSLPIAQSLGGPIHGSSYLLFSRYIKEINRPFKKGWGQLHRINWEMSYLGLSLSYWYGNNFSSENMGHPLYQSIRVEDDKVLHYERIRSLLFLSIYKDWPLRPGVTLQATFRPYYDFKNRLLEYGFSCKLVYNSQCTHIGYTNAQDNLV